MPTVKGSVFEADRQCASRVCAAGKLPGSVMTRYDLLGTYVYGRLQYAY
jgi:hypothetical protein